MSFETIIPPTETKNSPKAPRRSIPSDPTRNPYRRITLDNIRAMLRYLFFQVRYRNLEAGLFYIGSNSQLVIAPEARIRFGRSVEFMRDSTLHFGGEVNIGSKVYFNRGCHIVSLESLTIGANSIFGERVSIHDENHVIEGDQPVPERGLVTAPVKIGSGVWVGAKATILQGVTIGDNAVIGAHALVTRDIPANSVALGVPARVVRTINR